MAHPSLHTFPRDRQEVKRLRSVRRTAAIRHLLSETRRGGCSIPHDNQCSYRCRTVRSAIVVRAMTEIRNNTNEITKF
jgi:hypothetical protein